MKTRTFTQVTEIQKAGAKKKGAHNPTSASNPKHGAARTTKGVRTTGEYDPEGCFTQKPDTPHTRQWALGRKGRTTQRVRQTRDTGRRAQPKACARQGRTTQKGVHPETRHAAQEQVGSKEKGAQHPKGASAPETRAWRSTNSVRTTREHDPGGCFTQHPDTPHERNLALSNRGAQPHGCVEPGKRGGAQNQRHKGARPKRYCTQKPDAPHKNK